MILLANLQNQTYIQYKLNLNYHLINQSSLLSQQSNIIIIIYCQLYCEMSSQKEEFLSTKNNELLMFGLERSSRRNKTVNPFSVNSVHTQNSHKKEPMNIQEQVAYLKKKINWYQQKLDKIIIQFERQSQRITQIENMMLKNERQWYQNMNGFYNLSESQFTPTKQSYPKRDTEVRIKKEQIQLIKNSIIANNKQIQQIFMKLQQLEAFNILNRLCDIQNTIGFQVNIIKMMEQKISTNSKNVQALIYKIHNDSKSTQKKLKKEKYNSIIL